MGVTVGATASANLDENATAFFYFLEGAPDYSVERLDYYGSGSTHYSVADGTFLSGPGDGDDEINDPKDIGTDADSNVYVLDVYSSGEPVVKVYDFDMNFIGTFGDSVTISGDPLRLDCDWEDGSVHVLHTDGISVFTACEMPF